MKELRKRKKPRGFFKYKLYEGIELENRRRKEKEKLEKEISEKRNKRKRSENVADESDFQVRKKTKSKVKSEGWRPNY